MSIIPQTAPSHNLNDLHHLVPLITQHFTGKNFARVSPRSRQQFAIDVALVVLHVRCGYLVDSIGPIGHERISLLLEALRSTKPIFSHLVHVYEATTDQSFIVNKKMIHSLFGSQVTNTWTRFVDASSLSVTPMPNIVHSLIHQIVEQSPSNWDVELQLGSCTGSPEVALIPLAGLLLEYPVSYVVAPDSPAYLSRVPLDVYDCTLRLDGNKDEEGHSALKFSIPEALGDTDQFWQPDNIIAELSSRFSPRVNPTGPVQQTSATRPSSDTTSVLHVHHHIVTLDRVAL